MSAVWKRLVRILCSDAWSHDVRTTEHVLTRIERLAAVGQLSKAALSRILVDAGVTQSTCDLIAESIWLTIVSKARASRETQRVPHDGVSSDDSRVGMVEQWG